MCSCFNLLTQGRQNVSIKTLTKTSKFDLKLPSRSGDIKNIQTRLPQKGMHKKGH